jgi:hypothetical protein
MADITHMAARSGKVIRSDNTIVNEADGINDDGSRRVQLTGRNVEEITLLSPIALTNTNFISGNTVDLSKYKTYMIYVVNTHDVPVNFFVHGIGNGDIFFYNNDTKTFKTHNAGDIVIPSLPTGNAVIINDALPQIYTKPYKNLNAIVKAQSTPTVGSITAKLIGVVN